MTWDRNALPSRYAKPNAIYAVRPTGAQGPVKIGACTDLTRRLRMLNTGSPVRLEVIATLAGSVELEKRIHKALASVRERGEWFTHGPIVASVLEWMATGDPSLWPETEAKVRDFMASYAPTPRENAA